MGIHRSTLRRRRRTDASTQKLVNRGIKTKERIRRDVRMIAKVKTGSLPYTPAVMSWLSEMLDKPSKRVTPQDIKAMLG